MLDNKAHWVRLSKYTPYYKRFTTWFSYNDDGTEFKRKSSDQCQGTLIDSKTLVTAASCATYKYYKWGNNGYNANDDLLVDDGWHAYEYQVSYIKNASKLSFPIDHSWWPQTRVLFIQSWQKWRARPDNYPLHWSKTEHETSCSSRSWLGCPKGILPKLLIYLKWLVREVTLLSLYYILIV